MLASGVVLLFLVLAVAGATAAPPSVTATDLGTLGGDRSFASAVNDNGQVVGNAQVTVGSGQSHAFMWTQAGGMVELPSIGGGDEPSAISDSGQVVGRAFAASSGQYHAFSWTQAGGMVDIGTLPPSCGNFGFGFCSEALDVNNSGQVVGWSFVVPAPVPFMERAFSWTQAGGMVDLGTLGGVDSDAPPSTTAARSSVRAPQRLARSTRSRGRRRAGWSTSAPSAAPSASAFAVNNAGQVVGWS